MSRAAAAGTRVTTSVVGSGVAVARRVGAAKGSGTSVVIGLGCVPNGRRSAAASERGLVRAQRPEAERRPRVVEGDLGDRPQPVLGEDRPQAVAVDVGPVA